jgi:arylsulfatase A-like enzyme
VIKTRTTLNVGTRLLLALSLSATLVVEAKDDADKKPLKPRAVKASSTAANNNQEARRPNILWLIAEDLGPQLGVYGTKQVSTPNLDRLAGEGMRYTHMYNGNVCSPSRSAFMTGMYATSINAHNHRSHRDDGYRLPDGVRVLTDWLRPHGYFTANITKLPDACGFKGTGKTDWNFQYDGKPFDSSSWSDLKENQPFYAQINFWETHRDFHGPKHADPDKVEIPPYYPDHPVTRKDWAAYLDDITELDRKVGVVLRQLEIEGMADNTIVLFFGDNGQAHIRAKQFCYEEGFHVPLIIRWPNGIKAPAWFKRGTVDDRLLEGIDLAPTTLAMAQIPIPPIMQGQPIFMSNKEYVFGARDRSGVTVFRLRSVRDKRYRYIRNFTSDRPYMSPNKYKEKQYPVWNLLKELNAMGQLTPAQSAFCAPTMPPEELYDLFEDPHQMKNLAGTAGHAETIQRMRKTLDKWIEETHDAGVNPEPPDIAANAGNTKPLPPLGHTHRLNY